MHLHFLPLCTDGAGVSRIQPVYASLLVTGVNVRNKLPGSEAPTSKIPPTQLFTHPPSTCTGRPITKLQHFQTALKLLNKNSWQGSTLVINANQVLGVHWQNLDSGFGESATDQTASTLHCRKAPDWREPLAGDSIMRPAGNRTVGVNEGCTEVTSQHLLRWRSINLL